MRLPSRIATRSPRLRPSLAKPVAISRALLTASRQESRLSPHTSASPSPFCAAACSTISQMLFGRSQKAGTTRSPKRASSRMGGMPTFDQSTCSLLMTFLASHHRHADYHGVEGKGERQIDHDTDDHRDQIVTDTADRNRRTAGVRAALQRDAVEHRPRQERSKQNDAAKIAIGEQMAERPQLDARQHRMFQRDIDAASDIG